ncbi:MAG: response regulator [Desulfobacterales bacterium]|jgi:PAS domain S-box-containing protein
MFNRSFINTDKIRVHFWDQMVLIGFGLALFYSIFDSILYIFLSYDVDFFQRLFGPDISEIWSRVTILCLFIIFGSHAQFAINQRKIAEEALRASEEKYRTIIETTPDGYYEVDLAGTFTFLNDAMCNIFGYSRQEMSGMNTRTYLDKADSENLDKSFSRVLETGEPVTSLSWTLVGHDGSDRFVESSVSLIKDTKGQPIGFSGFVRDVTERRRAEALYREKLSAEAANRTKSEFLASMSHEIRTPLNSIIGLVDLTLQSGLRPDQREDLDVVKSSAYSLLSIINNILDFSKIEAGKLDFEEAPFSFKNTIDDSLRIMAMKAHVKGIELAYRIAPKVPDRLLGDPTRLRQVLLNLVDNAIKFTDKGEVIVYVASKKPSDLDVILHISVVDTGIGISKEKQRRIFTAYDQGDTSISRRFGGTGLGLAVSAQLVNLMGGSINVKSRPGEGSRFRFTARFKRQLGEALPDAAAAQTDLSDVNVMVVDDNASHRKILKELLKEWQMRPLLVSDAAAAQNMLTQAVSDGDPIKLMLIDSDMPDSDGFTLADWKMRQEMTETKVIMMLTFPHLKRKEELKGLGITAGVVKPVGPAELYRAILNALEIEKLPTKAADNAPEYASRIPSHSLKLLVAEDTPFNQKFIMRLLERWKHQATLVENGRQVLDTLQNETFDLILMDVQMPEMDGLEATKVVREHELTTGAHIPIIAMTAHAVKGDRERCLEAGMDEYISKPIDSDKLFDIIETLFRGRDTQVIPNASEEKSIDFDGFDKELLLKAFDHDWDFLKEVVDVFYSDYPRMLNDLQQAYKDRDASTLMRTAHSLKGMLRNFQADAGAEVAYEIEKNGKREEFKGVGKNIETLAGHLAGVEDELRKLIEQEDQ